jgi:hypothetical protein
MYFMISPMWRNLFANMIENVMIMKYCRDVIFFIWKEKDFPLKKNNKFAFVNYSLSFNIFEYSIFKNKI